MATRIRAVIASAMLCNGQKDKNNQKTGAYSVIPPVLFVLILMLA